MSVYKCIQHAKVATMSINTKILCVSEENIRGASLGWADSKLSN